MWAAVGEDAEGGVAVEDAGCEGGDRRDERLESAMTWQGRSRWPRRRLWNRGCERTTAAEPLCSVRCAALARLTAFASVSAWSSRLRRVTIRCETWAAAGGRSEESCGALRRVTLPCCGSCGLRQCCGLVIQHSTAARALVLLSLHLLLCSSALLALSWQLRRSSVHCCPPHCRRSQLQSPLFSEQTSTAASSHRSV